MLNGTDRVLTQIENQVFNLQMENLDGHLPAKEWLKRLEALVEWAVTEDERALLDFAIMDAGAAVCMEEMHQ